MLDESSFPDVQSYIAEVQRAASLQRTAGFLILAQLALLVVAGAAPILIGLGPILSICFAVVIWRLCGILGYQGMSRIAILALCLVPLINLVTIAVIIIKISGALRCAGLRGGFLGVDEHEFKRWSDEKLNAVPAW